MPSPQTSLKAEPQRPEAHELLAGPEAGRLLVILGPDSAAQILRSFDPSEVEGICGEMAKLTMISQELQLELLANSRMSPSRPAPRSAAA